MSFTFSVLCCLQSYSLKASDSRKLASYFVYIAKGITGKRGDRIRVLYESEPRPWAQLHAQFHDTKEEREAARAAAPISDFYQSIAAKCIETRKTSKEDVLSAVVNHYVEDSKKGFSTFQLQATFGRVFSLVNGQSAREFYYETAASQLFKW